MAQWTKQQLDCLDALGIPLWQFRAPAPTPEPDSQVPEPESPTPEATPQTEHYYRLGPWLFRFEGQLPVTGYPWLNDLAIQAEQNPVQVSAPTHPEQSCIDASPYARDSLSADDKRQLWNQLSAWLS
ncbi:hypothetical protein ACR0ST_02270 [Aliidiomarina sp. Khilg15.8]